MLLAGAALPQIQRGIYGAFSDEALKVWFEELLAKADTFRHEVFTEFLKELPRPVLPKSCKRGRAVMESVGEHG